MSTVPILHFVSFKVWVVISGHSTPTSRKFFRLLQALRDQAIQWPVAFSDGLENKEVLMKKRLCFGPRWLGLWAVIALSMIPSEATSLRVMNLADLVGHSQRIFSAVFQNVSSGFDENKLPYTSFSFLVTDSIHGVANQQVVVIKQFGLAEPIQLDNGVTQLSRIAGMPRYVAGQQYLLFLNRESRLGFSSPIGLLQGAFRVQGRGTSRTVVNGLRNANLLIDTRKSTQQRSQERLQNLSQTAPVTLPDERIRGPVSYDNLASLVRSLLAGESLDRPAASRLLGRERQQ